VKSSIRHDLLFHEPGPLSLMEEELKDFDIVRGMVGPMLNIIPACKT
jgi:hypothetical protein